MRHYLLFKKISTIILALLLLSSFEFTYTTQSAPDSNPDLIPKEDFSKLAHPKSIAYRKSSKIIATYDTFNLRDQALKQIDPSKISHIFKYIPSLTLKQISSDDIPTTGLISVSDTSLVKAASTSEQVELDSIYGEGFTLKETADILGITNLRNSVELTGEGITIAILDSGVSNTTQSFDNRISYSAVSDLASKGVVDQDGHGTHVTGIAASNGIYNIDNEWVQTDSLGMAPKSNIESIRVLDEEGSGDNDWILQGIELAIDKSVDIISLSLSTAIYEGDSDPIGMMIDAAIDAGIIVVAAAGNTGPIGSAVGVPAALPNVISVGAAVPRGGIEQGVWDFSGVGPAIDDYPGPDILAPGSNILSVNNTDGRVATLSGTSMAAPHVSGGIALLKQAFPSANLSHIREALLGSAYHSTSETGRTDQVEAQGRGNVRFDIAYNILLETLGPDSGNHTLMSVIPNRVNEWNYVYRHRIINHTKTFPFFIHSSRSAVIEPFIREDSIGVEFNIPPSISLIPGITRIDVGIKINTTLNDFVNAGIYFMDATSGRLLPNSNITIVTESIPLNGRILFDTSHDQDTKSSYFANHGPFGQYSQMSRLLEDRGYVIDSSRNQEITSELLDQYDILVISNPDLDYSSSEIEAIHGFTQNEGKSTLLLIDGGIFDAEGVPTYSAFNFNAVNSILEGSGLSVPYNSTSKSCSYDEFPSVEERDEFCVETAYMLQNQGIYQDNYHFAHFGPLLEVKDDLPSNVENIVNIALVDQDLVAASTEFDSKGRLLVYSSSLPFDNEGMFYDYIAGQSPDVNRDILHESIDWLVSPRKITMNYKYEGQLVNELDLNMHQPFRITFQPKDKDGNLLDLGQNVSLRMRVFDFELGASSYQDFLALKEGNSYIISAVIERHIQIDFYLPLNVSGNIPTNGHLRVTFNLKNLDNQGTFQILGRILFFLLVISWIFWYLNEGGREAKKQREIKEEQLKEENPSDF